MTDLIFCNSTAVAASASCDDSDQGLTWDRVVTLCMGITEDDGDQDMVAGLTLSSDQARELAQEMIEAADRVDSQADLGAHVAIVPNGQIPRC